MAHGFNLIKKEGKKLSLQHWQRDAQRPRSSQMNIPKGPRTQKLGF